MGNPVSPGKKTKFTVGEVGVKVVSIKDKDNSVYHDKKEDICPKTLDYIEKLLYVNYKIMGVDQKVNLWVEYKPSKIHDDFYKQYQKGDFQPPRVAWLVRNEKMKPGDYYITWDGRDSTKDLRILLAGEYEVKIEGAAKGWKKTHKTEIKIAEPVANLYGIHYYTKSNKLHSSKKEVEYGVKKIKSLKDGTKFDPSHRLDQKAHDAMEEMKGSALAYFGGHANPYEISFASATDRKLKKKDKSKLKTYFRDQSKLAYPDACLMFEKDGVFKDLLIILLNGCRTGNEITIFQNIVAKFNPGPIDGDHGPKTTKALTWFQDIHKLVPADGTKNGFTLQWFNVSSDLSEKKQTRAIQKKLKSYYAGKLTGTMNSRTKRALKNYQRDNPDLQETGELDEATFKALQIGVKGEGQVQYVSYLAKNIAQAMGFKGADITFGFEHKIDFSVAEEWQLKFWDNVVNGQGILTAANNAVAAIDHRKRKQCSFNIYAQKGVSKEMTLHPARYGATTFIDAIT